MKILTAGEITKSAIAILISQNCHVWRNNNLSVPGRKFIGLKGVPDIVGFHIYTGVAVYCEVKTVNDKFSEAQIDFMKDAKTAGCHCLVAVDKGGIVEIKDYKQD